MSLSIGTQNQSVVPDMNLSVWMWDTRRSSDWLGWMNSSADFGMMLHQKDSLGTGWSRFGTGWIQYCIGSVQIDTDSD